MQGRKFKGKKFWNTSGRFHGALGKILMRSKKVAALALTINFSRPCARAQNVSSAAQFCAHFKILESFNTNAKVIYPLFIQWRSLNKKGIDYLSKRCFGSRQDFMGNFPWFKKNMFETKKRVKIRVNFLSKLENLTPFWAQKMSANLRSLSGILGALAFIAHQWEFERRSCSRSDVMSARSERRSIKLWGYLIVDISELQIDRKTYNTRCGRKTDGLNVEEIIDFSLIYGTLKLCKINISLQMYCALTHLSDIRQSFEQFSNCVSDIWLFSDLTKTHNG